MVRTDRQNFQLASFARIDRLTEEERPFVPFELKMT